MVFGYWKQLPTTLAEKSVHMQANIWEAVPGPDPFWISPSQSWQHQCPCVWTPGWLRHTHTDLRPELPGSLSSGAAAVSFHPVASLSLASFALAPSSLASVPLSNNLAQVWEGCICISISFRLRKKYDFQNVMLLNSIMLIISEHQFIFFQIAKSRQYLNLGVFSLSRVLLDQGTTTDYVSCWCYAIVGSTIFLYRRNVYTTHSLCLENAFQSVKEM